MPVFQVHLEVEGDLRLSEELTLDGYQFSPRPQGFSIILQVDAPSAEAAKRDVSARIQLLMDVITFAKGTSLRYHFHQVTEMLRQEGGSQVYTTQVFMRADAYIVISEGRDGIAPAFDWYNRIPIHPKADVMSRVLRWYARGISDTDSIDKFLDYWVALETLAASYRGEVEPHNCQCGHTINPRPVRGILKAYMRSLGMNEAADRLDTLQDARSKLVHEASIKTVIEQPATVRTIEQLELSLQALDQALARMGKKVERSNSNVEVLTDGDVKAGICFLINNTQLPGGIEYPRTLTRTVRAMGAVDRDVHFLWKRTNGAFGVPNKAIEDWLGTTATSRGYSIVYDIISKIQHYGRMHVSV